MPVTMPTFGDPNFQLPAAPAMPSVPAPPAQAAPPATTQIARQTPAVPVQPQFQSATPQHGGVRDLLGIIPALIGGFKDPVGAGAFLAGIRQAQDRNRERALDEQTRQQKRAQDAARFYSDMLTHVQQFDDQFQLDQYLQAIKPMADYYGIPVDGMTVNSEKQAAKDRTLAQQAIDRIVKLHGPEALNDGAATVAFKGQPVPISTVLRTAGVSLTKDGQPVPILAGKPDVPNTPEEQFYAQYAAEHGAKSFRDLPTTQQAEARAQWAGSGRAPSPTPAVGSFEDYVVRKYGANPTPQQIATARREYGDAGRTTDPAMADMNRQIRELQLRQLQNGSLNTAQANLAAKVADDYYRDSKDYVTRVQAYQTIKAAAQQPSAAGDLALIFAFMKMLDPGSTVREGEFANAQNAAGVPDRIRNSYNRAMNGERLNETQRADFVNQSRAQLQQARTRQKGIVAVYTQRAKDMNLPVNTVVTDYDTAFGVTDADTTPPAGTTRKVGRFEIVEH